MNPNTIANGIGNALHSAANAVGNYFYTPPQTAQRPVGSNAVMSMKIKSPVATIPLSNVQSPYTDHPLPANKVPYTPIRPSGFQNTLNTIGQGIGAVEHMFGGAAPKAPAPMQSNVPLRMPSATPAITSPTPSRTTYPGENEFVQHYAGKLGGDAATYRDLYRKAVSSKGFSGNFFGQKQAVSQPITPPPGMNAQTPNPNINPNITIPYSQGGNYTLPAGLSQQILNAFNSEGEATHAAQVLNHPPQNTYSPYEVAKFGHDSVNRGENGSFRSVADATNSDGSIDRGLFRINSNTFQGMQSNPATRQKMAAYGISNWEDMQDPQKNAYMARLIHDSGGWERWFAAPLPLRFGGGQLASQ